MGDALTRSDHLREAKRLAREAREHLNAAERMTPRQDGLRVSEAFDHAHTAFTLASLELESVQ